MYYKSKDKDYMQALKRSVYRLEVKDGREESIAWDYLRRYVVINDLLEFIRNSGDNANIIDYNYNANLVDVDYAIVTATEHPKELAIADAFIKKAGISNVYRTSYSKSKSTKILTADSLTASLNSELKLIDAKRVIIFGPNIAKLIWGEIPIHEAIDGTKMVSSSIIQVLKSDTPTANKIKNRMWQDFQIIKINE